MLKKIISAVSAWTIITAYSVLSASAYGEANFSIPGGAIKTGEDFTVSVTFSAEDNIGSVQSQLTYDDNLIEFVSSDNASGGGGTLTVNGFPSAEDDEVTFSFTFVGVSEGTARLDIENCAIYSYDGSLLGSPTAYANVTVSGGGASTTADNTVTSAKEENPEKTTKKTTTAAEKTTSENESAVEKPQTGIPDKGVLTALTVDNGTLTPEFAYNVYDYTVYVDHSVDNVEIEGTTASLSDYIWYTGTSECQVGSNVRTITVTDVDGNSTTYTVTIIRAEEGETVTEPERSDKSDSSKVRKKVSSSAASSDAMEKYRDILNPALGIALAVLVIALVVIVIWIRGQFRKK